MSAAACRGAGADPPATPTADPPTTAPSATAAPSPTAPPFGPAEADGARILEHVRRLSVEIGPRPAGTPSELEARDYIQRELERLGYDVTTQEFAFGGTDYLPARVDAVDAPGRSRGAALSAIGFKGSAGGEASGPLVAIGLGRPEDIPPDGLNGAVALIERGQIEFREKARNAIAAGAAAVIIYNNEPGSLIAGVDESPVPVVSLKQEEGRDLAARAATRGMYARVTVTPPSGTSYNVIAKAKGATACETVSGGHYDSVPVAPGADDNASGTAGVLELARVVAAAGMQDGNCFVLFGAEEVGLKGSRAFVDALTDTELLDLRVMLNLDVIGTDAALSLIGSEDIVEVARIEAERIGVAAEPGQVPAGTGSDHLSFEAGRVPVIMFFRLDTLIHTPQDAIDRSEPASLEDTVRLAFATLQALRR